MVLRGLLAVWLCVAVVSAPARARADAAEIEALIAKGNELRRAGTPGPALPYFQKAYQLARTPRTSGQLGLAELAAGYPVEAADHLAAALESPTDPSIVKYRQMLVDALTMARSQIGELAIQGGPPGAEVLINGRAVGVLPLASPVKLAARTSEVVVRAPGYTDRRESVPIVGGQRQELTVNLEKIEKPAEAPAVVVPAPSRPAPLPASSMPVLVQSEPPSATGSGAGLRTAAWVAGGGALAAAGAGLALQFAARSALDDFNAACANPPAGIMALPGGPLSDTACRDQYDTWGSYKRWSVVGYVSGAALAVTSTVLFLTSRPTPQAQPPTARTQLACAPTLNGFSCQGLF